MRTKTLLTAALGLAALVIVVWLSKSTQGDPETYEIRPGITIPEYRTDAARAIDAYERLMDRYMGLTERNLVRIETDLDTVVRKLDSIDRKLTELSLRISRIEKRFGAVEPNSSVRKKERPTIPDDNADNKL